MEFSGDVDRGEGRLKLVFSCRAGMSKGFSSNCYLTLKILGVPESGLYLSLVVFLFSSLLCHLFCVSSHLCFWIRTPHPGLSPLNSLDDICKDDSFSK